MRRSRRRDRLRALLNCKPRRVRRFAAAGDSVVKIEVTANPLALLSLREALDDLGCAGVTMAQARTTGLHSPSRIGIQAPLRTAVRLEVLVPEQRVAEAIESLTRAARQDGRADGRIVVVPLSGAVRLGTGEPGGGSGAGPGRSRRARPGG